MKKLALIIVIFSILAGCSTAQQTSASAAMARLQMDVKNGCMVVQPTLQAVAAIDPTVQAAAVANGLFCATAGAVDVASVQTMVTTGIPAIEKAVTDSSVVPSQQKPLVIAALGVFQLTLTNAFAIYGQAVVSPVAATK